MYADRIISEALEAFEVGVNVSARVLNNLRFTDNEILIAASERNR